ncbi:hypothetical protein RhiirA5_441991 [Rhizophagus irregularis]|uniref:Uncharacterized protein n=1 Tax=Rhizophagus irregularis TaxID=588596 RepID=A0A2N0NF70_9GLOM|nr:hypothetical protein RhiirA5_441991 [Rhizophagus irregularis]PKC54480.1 hypothetical protein RhiirA1_477246 [Rhizophagus irregularis]
MAELNVRKKTTPLILAYEATKSIYSYCYLTSECRSTGRIAGLVEVKRDDFKQGFAQATVQMESSLTCHKRKANEIEEYDMDKCTLDDERKPSFKLSEPVIVEYNDENMQIKVERVLGHIVWLLDEAQKPGEITGSGEREIKRVRSGELPKVTDLEGKTN